MKYIKVVSKKILRIHSQSNVASLNNIVYLGFYPNGYHIPDNFFDSTSICYCVGAGTNISFDIELVTKYGSKVFIFDPMPYAVEHFNELVNKTKASESLTIIGCELPYTYKINSKQLETIRYIETGIWNEKKLVKFFVPSRENYAGHSITNLQNTDDYIEAKVDTIVNLMKELNHTKIDLLKIEIEGSEYTVIDDIVKSKPDIKIILVEFDEFHHRDGKNMSTLKRIRNSSEKLCNAGYKLVHSTEYYKRTFIRTDVFELLKRRS
jgi:FkbM family methyltransferase